MIVGAWHGPTRVHGSLITYPVATLVIRRQFQQHMVNMTRVWRNSAGTYDWHDFEYRVRVAAALAIDMELSKEKMLLEHTLTLRQFTLLLFGCPAVQ